MSTMPEAFAHRSPVRHKVHARRVPLTAPAQPLNAVPQGAVTLTSSATARVSISDVLEVTTQARVRSVRQGHPTSSETTAPTSSKQPRRAKVGAASSQTSQLSVRDGAACGSLVTPQRKRATGGTTVAVTPTHRAAPSKTADLTHEENASDPTDDARP